MAEVVTERANGRLRVQTLNIDESKTVQADASRADIKKILAQYEATGVLVDMSDVKLEFRDVTAFEDFADLMFQSKEAEREFMRLDPRIRDVFENDTSRWLDAANDGLTKEQADKFVELGILEAVAPPAPAPIPVVPEVPAAPVPEVPPTSP